MKLRPHGSRWVRGVLATALTLLVVLDNPSHAQGLKVAQHLKKLDGLLRVDVDQQAGGARRGLIRATAADKDALRQLLASQGNLVLPDVGEGDTLNVVVPAEAVVRM